MKKWILFTCMALVSPMASAVITVMWRINQQSLMSPVAPTESLSGGFAYLFYVPNASSLTTAFAETQAAIQNGTFSTFTGGSSADLLESAVTVKGGGTQGTYSGFYTSTNSKRDTIPGYFFTLVFDAAYEEATYYTISAPLNTTTPNLSPSYFDWTGVNFPSSWQPVPEPTGVVLFALGAAAIALRRRVRP